MPPPNPLFYLNSSPLLKTLKKNIKKKGGSGWGRYEKNASLSITARLPRTTEDL
jgi:hypothetical protein